MMAPSSGLSPSVPSFAATPSTAAPSPPPRFSSFRLFLLNSGLAFALFSLLSVGFSPNWWAFHQGLRSVEHPPPGSAAATAIEQAILNGHSARGFFVVQQSRNLATAIPDPNHQIIRWRLLVPFIAHTLQWPSWATLGFAHLGCLALCFALISLAQLCPTPSSLLSTFAFGIVAGATAPFFTSMGWLGYYDSWLALGLLSVAFTRPRLVVIAVCLLTPWIDERFVLGLPLALFIRLLSPLPAALQLQPLSIRTWFFDQALWPVVVVLAYAVLRLSLGGSGSSATLSSYLNQFVFSQKISAPDRLFGAWSGLRVAWLFVLLALVGRYPGRLLLSCAAALTAFLAVVTALDSSRSVVLLLPLLPLGWRTAIASPRLHPRYLPLASAALAVLACALPAHHVVGRFVIPVDRCWLPSLPLLNAQKNLGVLFSSGAGVTPDPSQGAAWYRRAAEQNFPEAQNNLAVLYASGRGVSQDYAAAAFWYHRAALQGNATAQNNLGHLFAQGLGVTKDSAAALSWYQLSANQGDAAAQNNLGLMYASGQGVPLDPITALHWYRLAAAQGLTAAQSNVGLMYASGQGVPLDHVSARHWTALAAHQNDANAQKNLAILFYAGLGGPTDFSAAAHYFQLAADQGVPSAASSLGALFARGEGVSQDSALAYAWLAIAAARGETAAAAQLPSLKKSLSPSQLSTALLVIDAQLGKFSQNGK